MMKKYFLFCLLYAQVGYAEEQALLGDLCQQQTSFLKVESSPRDVELYESMNNKVKKIHFYIGKMKLGFHHLFGTSFYKRVKSEKEILRQVASCAQYHHKTSGKYLDPNVYYEEMKALSESKELKFIDRLGHFYKNKNLDFNTLLDNMMIYHKIPTSEACFSTLSDKDKALMTFAESLDDYFEKKSNDIFQNKCDSDKEAVKNFVNVMKIDFKLFESRIAADMLSTYSILKEINIYNDLAIKKKMTYLNTSYKEGGYNMGALESNLNKYLENKIKSCPYLIDSLKKALKTGINEFRENLNKKLSSKDEISKMLKDQIKIKISDGVALQKELKVAKGNMFSVGEIIPLSNDERRSFMEKVFPYITISDDALMYIIKQGDLTLVDFKNIVLSESRQYVGTFSKKGDISQIMFDEDKANSEDIRKEFGRSISEKIEAFVRSKKVLPETESRLDTIFI